ncbi:MAG: ABC transporter permease [Candidatus Aminicenantaceae bacterium]
MLKNYLTIALRNFKKYKGYSFINIMGLALGMASFLLIIFFIQFENSYDNFHENKKNIYQVIRINESGDVAERKGITGAPLAPLLLENFAAITHTVRFTNFQSELVNFGEKRFVEKRFFYADESVFDVFTFPLLQGNPRTALQEPFSVVVSVETAHKYFGNENPIGRTLKYNLGGRKLEFQVTGVLAPIPLNSHIRFDFLASYKSLQSIVGEYFMTKHWDSPTWTYIQLPDGYNPEDINQLLPAFTKKHVDKWSFSSISHELLPMTDIYFHAPGPPVGERGNPQFLFVLSMISVFILLIACINFMNLATARSGSRAKEIGMRKVIGAQRSQLVRQFVGESVCLSFLALLIAIILIELFLPAFNQFVGKALSINYLQNIDYIVAMIATAIIVGILSGSYPAFFLSSFKPVAIFKETLKTRGLSVFVRKTLVVGQFVISIALIASVVLLIRQIQFMRTMELGFNKNHVITIPIRDRSVKLRYELLKNKWLQNPNILGVTASSMEPGVTSQNGINIKTRGIDDMNAGIIYVDHDYVRTLEIKLARGRDFSKNISTDAEGSLLMNQAMVDRLGLKDGVGEQAELFFKEGGKINPMYQTVVVGIVNNFNYRDLTTPMQPILIKIDPERYNYIFARINSSTIKESIDFLETVWKEYQFDQPFEFSFLVDDMNRIYRRVENFAAVARYGTFFAIFIACLGLFGLASFTVENRTKEIGIRKVLGATVPGLVRLISKEFLSLVLLANIIAWPVAYYAMNVWLQNFAYRTSIEFWTFLVAAGLAFLIAMFTVSYQAIKASLSNPVDSLRYE